MGDPRVKAFRAALKSGADSKHAAFHNVYPESELRYHGVRTAA